MADTPKSAPTAVTKSIPEDYTMWGGLADNAKGQGFYPVHSNNDFVEYRNKYGLFNIVNIPNSNQKGYLSVTGNRSTGKFDILIKDALGNTLTKAAANASPQEVNSYFSNIAGYRANQVGAGTNTDKAVNGQFAALYK
jgi:hypothetical protein